MTKLGRAFTLAKSFKVGLAEIDKEIGGLAMKEYKFRGKCIERDKWVYGYYVKGIQEDEAYILKNHNWLLGDDFIDVYPETVGQFTGVKECYPQMVGEGQEIYFGDVVRLFGVGYDQTIVVKSAYDIVAMGESENVQLLGNVWDNPDLLKLVRRP